MKYKKVDMQFKRNFHDLVKASKSIIIAGHSSADDDSIASCLATYFFLTSKYKSNKNIQIVYTGTPVTRFHTFLNFDKIRFVNDLSDHLDTADLLILLDGNTFNRFTYNPDKIRRHNSKKICIDHHGSPPDKFNLSLISPQATSASELVYRIMSPNMKLTKDISEILLLGIFGDTGTFSYVKPNQLDIFDISKKLLKISNIEIQEFKSRYQSIPIRVFEIIKELLKNTQLHQRIDGNSFQSSYVSREFVEKYKYSDEEISEASHIYAAHYLRAVENYKWGFVITHKSTDCSISLRSLPGSVSVRNIMERMGIGGGHDRAAGGDIKAQNPTDAVSVMVDWINKNELLLS